MQVRSWIELLGEFGDAVGSAEDALKIAELYPNDEPIRSALLSVLFLNHRSGQQQPTDPELDDDEEDSIPNPERDAFRTLLADYIRDFPDGSIRQVAVDLENPLESIKAAIGDRPDTSEIDATVAKGGLPVGFAAAIHGRNYLETLLTREFGPVYAATRDVDAEASAIALAHEKGAVLDTSALVTLAYLPDEVRVLVGGHLPNLRVVVEQHRDARIGLRSAARNSGLSIIPSPAGGRPSIDHRSPEELANRRVLAEAIEASFARFSSVSNPKVSALTELADFDRPFLLAADLAFATNVPLWADDQALKDIANASGALSFGTPEFLRHLREEGRVNSDLIDLAEASLVAHGYGGIRFTSNVWQLATSLGRSPSSLMNAIRIAATDDLVARIKFAQSQIDINVDQPQDLTGFVHALAQWLEKIAPSEEVAIQNLEVLARQLLGKPWMTSSTLPYCVAAFRAIDGRVDGARVLLHQIFRMFEALAQQVDDRTAAEVVFGLVSRLDPEDGMRVRSAIFSRRFE
jgi:hypothetical protein